MLPPAMATPQERWECPNCGTPLNIATLGIYAKVACPACGHIDHVHTMLANYRIEGVLGLGGMSVVLRARDLVLERPLAIKLLNEFYRDQPERIARFEQECELMAKVRHEHVVSVYSAGRVKGQFYIAMELINGRNLEELVREQGPMDPLRALDVLRQVVLGLQAAYKAGLLHRDMKPGNIIICEDGRAKVLDFGLSLGKREENTEEIIWATPYYVPPETLQRGAEDTRTDIYALGMTLRHLLTGQENFDPAPESIDDMLACKRQLPPMAEQLPDLPEPYCDLIDHMTAFEPAARPDGYESLLVEIAEVRSALLADKVGLLTRLRRAVPLLVGAAASLGLGALAAAMTSYLATPEPQPLYASPAATLPWPERDLPAAALQLMQAGQLSEAAALLAPLADAEGEPAAAVWAALHGAVLSSLLGEEERAVHFRRRLVHHISRSPLAAGQPWHAQVAAMQEPGAKPEDKFLQAASQLECAQAAATACDAPELRRRMQAARIALRGAGAAYAPLLEAFSTHEARLLADQPRYAEQHYRRALAQLDVAAARQALGLMASGAQASNAARFSVQKEALDLFAEAVGMMQRRALMPAAGAELSAKELEELLQPLGKTILAAEIATLMLVAEGEFEAAARTNPYAAKPESPQPFAVIMRDWMERVK